MTTAGPVAAHAPTREPQVLSPGGAAPRRRPWLFLDVDGVICPVPNWDELDEPFDASDPAPPAGYMTWDTVPGDIWVNERLPEWAVQLDEAFEVVWATSWEEAVLRDLAEPLGLPEWPVLQVIHRAGVEKTSRTAFKADSIAEQLTADPRPFAWAEDHIDRDTAPPILRRLGLEYLLIGPDQHIGVTQAHVDQLLAFARDV